MVTADLVFSPPIFSKNFRLFAHHTTACTNSSWFENVRTDSRFPSTLTLVNVPCSTNGSEDSPPGVIIDFNGAHMMHNRQGGELYRRGYRLMVFSPCATAIYRFRIGASS